MKHKREPNKKLKKAREDKYWSQQMLASKLETVQTNISRWETGITFPSLYFVEKLCSIFGMTREELGLLSGNEDRAVINDNEKASQVTQTELAVESLAEQVSPLVDKDSSLFSSVSSGQRLPRYWSVPYERNPYFTDRNDLLRNLSQDLVERTSLFPVYAISGMPGVGKTQVAIEYAYQAMNHYQAIFWLRADTTENLQADLIDAAHLLGLPETVNSNNQKAILHAVIQWFSRNEQWLLIADNVERIEDITNLFLFQNQGHIILTTRLAVASKPVIIKEIQPLELEDSTTLLLRRADILSKNNDLKIAQLQDLEPARVFSLEVGGLPLVLDQAGAYVHELECSLSEYLGLYQTQRRVLLERRGERTFGHPDSVVATISLALRKIQTSSPVAAELLYLYAFLAPDNIPETIVSKGLPDQNSLFQSVSVSPSHLKEAHGLLSRYGLIRSQPATSKPAFFRMHRLVQDILKDLLEPEQTQKYAELAIRVVSRVVTELTFAQWDQYRNYIAHARACISHIDKWNINSQEAAQLISWTALYLHEQNEYEEAESLIEQSLAMLAQRGEQQSKLGLNNMNQLASLALDRGDYVKAEKLYHQLLTSLEQSPGESSLLSQATIQNNLGELYTALARYQDAEQYFQQALLIRKKFLGVTHELVATSYYCLAEAYSLQGKYTEATSYFQQALDIRQQRFESEHPSIAESLNGIGANLFRQGYAQKAEVFFLQALSIREKAFGSNHSSVAQIYCNLADCYINQQEKIQKAEEYLQKALQINVQIFGADHPDVAECFAKLALASFMQNSFEPARRYFEQALSIQLRIFGPDHIGTIELLKRGRTWGFYYSAQF